MLQFHRSVALVRRTESSVQLGVDDPVLIDGLTAGDLSLIDRLCRGCEPDEYLEAAQRRGVGRTRALSLLDLLTEAAQQSTAALITITHDPAIAARADRRFTLDGGVLT